MIVRSGLRVGYWRSVYRECPFTPLGRYVGPDLGDHLVGSKLDQKLLEGDLIFSVGVLYRPELSKKQRLETILILETYLEEMWEYDTWEKTR